VPAGDLVVKVLEEADPGVPAGVGPGRVARKLDEVDPVWDLNGT
jgi:hypothetical protein